MLPGVVVRVVSSDVGCVLGVCWVYRMASVVSAVAQARKFTYKTGLACAVAYGGGENMRDQLRCVSPPPRARSLSLCMCVCVCVCVCMCVYVCMYVCMYVPASYPCGRMHQPPRAPTVTINVLWWNVLSYGIECVL
jgi:hypothetical protein